MSTTAAAALALLILLSGSPALAGERYALLVTGASGGAQYAEKYKRPVAFVVPRDGRVATTIGKELGEIAERTLAPHQRPREIRLVAELPRTATGKLQRFRLREELGG